VARFPGGGRLSRSWTPTTNGASNATSSPNLVALSFLDAKDNIVFTTGDRQDAPGDRTFRPGLRQAEHRAFSFTGRNGSIATSVAKRWQKHKGHPLLSSLRTVLPSLGTFDG